MSADRTDKTDKYKQVIIVRRDLDMSPGKLAAQVSHAAMAFLSQAIKDCASRNDDRTYHVELNLDEKLVEEWIGGIFTKVILGAKSKTKIDNALKIADDLGFVEGQDYFVIKDSCLTELVPEEEDKNGRACTMTCVGFRPMPSSQIDPIGKRFQLLH